MSEIQNDLNEVRSTLSKMLPTIEDDEIKNKMIQSSLIYLLCKIYEKGINEKLTEKNFKKDINILNFISEMISPIKEIGFEITLSSPIIKKLVQAYIKVQSIVN